MDQPNEIQIVDKIGQFWYRTDYGKLSLMANMTEQGQSRGYVFAIKVNPNHQFKSFYNRSVVKQTCKYSLIHRNPLIKPPLLSKFSNVGICQAA